MTAVAHAALLVASLLAICGTIIAWFRARAHVERDALLRARERDSQFAGATRALAHAARESVVAVRHALADAVRAAVPQADGVLFHEEHDGALACSGAFGARFGYYAGTIVARDDTGALPARALTAGHRITLADHGVLPLHPRDAAAIAVPLVLDAGRACVLTVAAPTELCADAVERIVALAEQAAPAYAIALDREHDRRCAEYDALTGLLTPGAFRRRLVELVERSRCAPSAPLVLAFADTDRFKDWNDRYGHAAGDALLRALAQVLRDSSGPHDLVARNGGDEFCVVFAGAGKADAIERAEALRRRVAGIEFAELAPPGARGGISITASIGVAAFPADARSASDLLERADAAMYHSKETGRNGVSYIDDHGAFVRLGGSSAGFIALGREARA